MPPHVTSTECKPFADLNYTTVPLLYPILAKEQKGAFGSKDRIIEFPGGGSLFPKKPDPTRASTARIILFTVQQSASAGISRIFRSGFLAVGDVSCLLNIM